MNEENKVNLLRYHLHHIRHRCEGLGPGLVETGKSMVMSAVIVVAFRAAHDLLGISSSVAESHICSEAR